MIKKIRFQNTTENTLVFNMWSANKVTAKTNLSPIKPGDTRELDVIVQDDTYEPKIQFLSPTMIIPN